MPMDLTWKKIGILINQPFCLEVVFLFTVPLGITTFSWILFQYSTIEHVHISSNVYQWHILNIIRCGAYLGRTAKENYIENVNIKMIKVFLNMLSYFKIEITDLHKVELTTLHLF